MREDERDQRYLEYYLLRNKGTYSENEQETHPTGDVELSTEVKSSGNNSNSCVAPLQFGNTGNLQNDQNFIQYDSIADDVEFGGSSFSFEPSQEVTCDQKVQQAAAASGGGK
jgi:hypothetical protein